MALKFIEGFELYNGSTTVPDEMRTKWTVDDFYSCKPKAAGRLFGYACEIGENSGHDSLTTPVFSSHNTWIVGFAVKRESSSDLTPGMPSPSYATGPFFYVYNGSSIACQLDHQATSIVLKNAGGSTLHTWTVEDKADVWEYLEIKFVVNGASSSAELRVDGVSLGSSGTKTFSQSTANKFKFNTTYGGISGLGYSLDDVYICDGSGSAQNDFLGECAVEGLVPTGAGTTTMGTPSTGSNYSCVDEKPGNGDTDHITLGTIGDLDLYAFGNLTQLTGTIIGIQANAVAKQSSGSGELAIVNRYSGINYQSDPTDGSLLSTYRTVHAISTTSNGSTAWTVSSVNAAEFGPKLVSP